MPSSKNELPTREANVFKQVVRLYEGKNVKKAVKAADSILKKFPNHGETLAMKGLALNSLDRKEEAHDLVKRGLKMHMNSHICWHVYGLLYRSNREYRAAAKAYLNALRYEPTNQQILRDLSLLQIQIRDFEGLEDTRRKLLTHRPNNKNNWIGFALAFHLLGNYSTAISVLDTYQDMPKGHEDRGEEPYELSEITLYKNLILEEAGRFEDALKHLNENEDSIVDFLGLRETRARLFSQLGRHEECAKELHELLGFNADNVAYYRGLVNTAVMAARKENGDAVENSDAVEKKSEPKGPLSADDLRRRMSVNVDIRDKADVEAALKVLNVISLKFPRNSMGKRIALDVLPSGDHPEFLPRLDAYVRPFLRRGVPSLFSDIKTLYTDRTKAEAAGRLFENYKESLLSAVGALPPQLRPEETKKDEEVKKDGILLWVYHYLAQHYDRIGLRNKALGISEKAIETSPETVECYLVKARILKHLGDTISAVNTMDKVRSMELSDRYLNTKCTKYGLRADMMKEAEGWIGLFTRDGDHGGAQALYEMQSMWFELEAAESHLRCGEYSQAFKKFTAVDRHIADMVEDQFDFHSYCLRKVTLRSYVSLLRFEDRIRGHRYYERAAVGMVRVLLSLADLPEQQLYAYAGEHADIEGFANMTESERKKAISKKKKRQAKLKNSAQKSGGKNHSGTASSEAKTNGTKKTEANGNSNSEKPKTNPGFMDLDPEGTELVKTSLEVKDGKGGALEKAVGYIREMENHLSGKLATHILAFEVAIRRKFYLQALRAVKRAQKIDAEHPDTLYITLRLAYAMDNGGREGLSEMAARFFKSDGDVLNGRTPPEFLAEYKKRTNESARCRVGAAVARLRLTAIGEKDMGNAGDACEEVVEGILGSEAEGMGANALDARQCKRMVEQLRGKCEEGLVKRILHACQQLHPNAVFPSSTTAK